MRITKYASNLDNIVTEQDKRRLLDGLPREKLIEMKSVLWKLVDGSTLGPDGNLYIGGKRLEEAENMVYRQYLKTLDESNRDSAGKSSRGCLLNFVREVFSYFLPYMSPESD